jgi:hypothetical protein
MYMIGQGVPQDFAEAAKWTRLAAEQGNTDAQSNLGGMLQYGHGVTQDYAEAVKWYRLAAEQGYADAQFDLGVMYFLGQGVPQDYVHAHMWINLAAAQGDEVAAKDPDEVTAKMTPRPDRRGPAHGAGVEADGGPAAIKITAHSRASATAARQYRRCND